MELPTIMTPLYHRLKPWAKIKSFSSVAFVSYLVTAVRKSNQYRKKIQFQYGQRLLMEAQFPVNQGVYVSSVSHALAFPEVKGLFLC